MENHATDPLATAKVLLEDGDIVIERVRGLSPEIIQFLDSVTWGTDYSLYEHLDTHERANYLSDPHLLILRVQGRIGGTAVFTRRDITVKNKKFNSYYVRYFAASPEIKGRGLMKKYGTQIMKLIREGVTEKTVFWGAIERGNIRSWKVASGAGYSEMVRMKTLGFSRFFPKPDQRMEEITTPAGRQEVTALLQKYYESNSLLQFQNLFIHNNYFVLREKGEIIAGAQAHQACWSVKYMPGLKGKIILHVIPVIPYVNKIFNPRKFEFLGFEGIYFREGHEHDLHKLFSSILHRFNRNSALFWFDPRESVYHQIRRAGGLGLIYPFVKSADSRVMVCFENMSQEEQELVRNYPAYLSAFDFL